MDNIQGFDRFSMLKSSSIHSRMYENEISCYCPGGCGGNNLSISAYQSCHLLVYGYWGSSTTYITDNAKLKIVDAWLTLIFKMR
jgi:hypothetical protein